jgi:hypothetical protein
MTGASKGPAFSVASLEQQPKVTATTVQALLGPLSSTLTWLACLGGQRATW